MTRILSDYGREQAKKLLDEERKIRSKTWLSFNPKKIYRYYKNLNHRKNCIKCRVAHTRHLAELAGVEL